MSTIYEVLLKSNKKINNNPNYTVNKEGEFVIHQRKSKNYQIKHTKNYLQW